jgi:hypothetical protein
LDCCRGRDCPGTCRIGERPKVCPQSRAICTVTPVASVAHPHPHPQGPRPCAACPRCPANKVPGRLDGGAQAAPARAGTGALRWRQQRGIGADQATASPQRDQALVLHVLYQLGVQTPQGGDVQLGACLGQCPLAEQAQNAQICVHVGKKAVNLALNAAPAKPTQASDQLEGAACASA